MNFHSPIFGGFLTWGYPPIIQDWIILVLKLMFLGNPQFLTGDVGNGGMGWWWRVVVDHSPIPCYQSWGFPTNFSRNQSWDTTLGWFNNWFKKPLLCGFPEIGVPLVIIHFSRIFHYKPSILGYHHFRKPLIFPQQFLSLTTSQSRQSRHQGGHLSQPGRKVETPGQIPQKDSPLFRGNLN